MDRLAALESRVAELVVICAEQHAVITQLAVAVAAMQRAMMESAERLPGEMEASEALRAQH